VQARQGFYAYLICIETDFEELGMHAENSAVDLPLLYAWRLCIVKAFDPAVRGTRIPQKAGSESTSSGNPNILTTTHGGLIMMVIFDNPLRAQAMQRGQIRVDGDQ
jgi:hypothetical protein